MSWGIAGIGGRPDPDSAREIARALRLQRKDSASVVNSGGEDRASRFFSAAELEGKPVQDRDWLVPGMIPGRTVTLFSGDGGSGKSLLTLQLAVAVAARRPWLRRAVKSGRALFLSAEDDEDELHRRLDAIRQADGLEWSDLAGLTIRSVAGEDALLAREVRPGNGRFGAIQAQLGLIESELFRELDARAEAERPDFVGIDTAADVYPGNENDRATVRQFIGILRGLAIRQKTAVTLLSHPSLTGLNSGSGMSGSTAWNNSVRARLYLSRVESDGHEPDEDRRVLRVMKANYGRIGDEIAMTWTEGVFVADATETGLDRLAAAAKAERVFLKLLDEFTAQDRFVSASPSSAYAPTLFAKNPGAEGLSKRALASAMEALFSKGAIVVAEHGAGAKARKHIARKGASS